MTDGSVSSDAAIEERIREVGADLAQTLRMVIEAVPGRPLRPNQLARELGLNRAISSRVLSATSKKDPLEVTHLIPGPEPLRSLLRAASAKDVDSDLVARAEAAVAQFELLISNEAGTRSGLDAIISSRLPDAREKLELAAKYSTFKGMSQLLGVQAETWVTSMLIHPAADDTIRLDVAPIHGALGMQRLRSGVPVDFSFGKAPPEEEEPTGESDAPPIGSMPLDKFYTNPPAKLKVRQEGEVVIHSLAGDGLGPRSVVDMLAADHHHAAIERYSSGPRQRRGSAVVPDIPVKVLLFDVLLHEDVFPGSEPELLVYDMGMKGRADVNDPKRDIDRMTVHESIEFLGRDLSRFHATEVPNYVQMLLHVCDRLRWHAEKFRGYRCRIQYPVHGWQVCMAFDPPPAPEQT
ncbi:MAG: hypothetical protein JSV91_03790 [Phycisphaerales bacterium]|nr:MAG: hypothetical protein JSV91_03790 [Phycisphaerales bacterium]